jgi:biopolymer transport protein ExbB/TolQ
MTKKPQSIMRVIQSLGWPIFWGLAAFIALLVGLQQHVITNETVIRYVTAHPISYATTLMFCVGIASLLLKSSDVFQQFTTLSRIQLDAASSTGATGRSNLSADSLSNADRATQQLNRLELMPGTEKSTYLWKRLSDVLDAIRRGGDQTRFDEELKYLSDMDAARQQDGFALVRILIWATPMLGFLGTVIGISAALGSLNVGPEQNFEKMMSGLSESLYVAFDTTALALTLSILMMFGQFLVDRFEMQLLSAVDDSASQQINDHFQISDNAMQDRDPYLNSVKRMSLMVLESIEQISEKQTGVWRDSIRSAMQDVQLGINRGSEVANQKLSEAVSTSLTQFSENLRIVFDEMDRRTGARWEQWQQSLHANVSTIHAQQQELVRQAELLNQAIDSCGDVVRIQDALNENLRALSRADSFEQMIATLSAAVNLLSVRIDAPQPNSRSKDKTSKAA